MRIWLDDIREKPEDFTVQAYSVKEAKKIIEKAELENEEIELISLGHDLGEYALDGGDGIYLLDWLVERKTMYPVEFHTANPVGRANMQRIIDRWWW